MPLSCSGMIPLSGQFVLIWHVACGEGLGEMLDGRGGAGRFRSFVCLWALSSLWSVVLSGSVGFCWAGGYVWFRYRSWGLRPKAGDAVCRGGCVFVQVDLMLWWPRVPFVSVIVRGVEVDALLDGPAVVGQAGL